MGALQINESTPIIGVAKTRFGGTPKECEILRGKSKVPLFETAADTSLAEAKANILAMHGANRIPTLLKLADSTCRDKLQDEGILQVEVSSTKPDNPSSFRAS